MFDRQAFIDNILDHYENPRHRGKLDDATVTIKGGNPGCGDIIEAYLKLDENERIVDASFDGEGCTISQAAASILSEQIIGKTLQEVNDMDHTQFIEDLGREVVINRLKCATLALNTVKAAERKYHAQQAGEASAEPGTSNDEVINF
ncbi:MAG: SUF system NifU family Fe-S cluster assembly protein [Anaerolineae bacterium]|nr:SUF system NifU family Fe-S cluster assembly protein [Anaerolineae bacterium]